MSYLPSKTCFQSLRFTHCMPASLLSAPPPFPPPSRLYIPQPGLHQKYVALPFILRPTDSSVSTHISLFLSLVSMAIFLQIFLAQELPWIGCCHSLAPPHSPLSPAHSPPPPNQVFLTISSVLFSLLSLLYSSCPIPHTTTSRPLWGLLLRFFGLRACRWTIHVLRSRSMATSARRFRCLLFFPLLPVSGVCMLSPPKQEPRIIPGCLG